MYSKRETPPDASVCVSALPSPSYVHDSVAPSGAVRRARLPSGCHSRQVTPCGRVGDTDGAAEGVPLGAGDGAAGVGDPCGQAGGVALHVGGGAEGVGDRGEAAGGVVRVVGGGSGGVGDRGAVAAFVELLEHAVAVRADDLHGQAGRVAHGAEFAAVGRGGGDEPVVLVVREGGAQAQRVGAGVQVAARVVGEPGGVAERIGDREAEAAGAEEVTGGVAVGGGERGGVVAGLGVRVGVGEGDLYVPGLAALRDDPVLVVVDVVVAAVVGVDPGDDAAAVVVDEGGRGTGRLGDGGEVAVLVAVAHQEQVRAVLARAGQGQGGDPAVGGRQGEPPYSRSGPGPAAGRPRRVRR